MTMEKEMFLQIDFVPIRSTVKVLLGMKPVKNDYFDKLYENFSFDEIHKILNSKEYRDEVKNKLNL